MRRLTFSLDTSRGRDPSDDTFPANTPGHTSHEGRPLCYSTNVPATLLSQQSDLIEQLMGFARTLGARHLEVLVRDDE